jgi:hypothetical protein
MVMVILFCMASPFYAYMHYAPALILSKAGPPRSHPAPVRRGPSPKELFLHLAPTKLPFRRVLGFGAKPQA